MDFCIGIDAYDLGRDDCLQELQALGVRQLSLPEEAIMGQGLTRQDVLALKDRLARRGLRAVTSHPPFGSYNEPFSALRQDLGREADILWLKDFITRCGLLGIHAIPLHTGGAMLPQAQDWERALLADYVAALTETAAKAHVILAIENTNHARPIGWRQGLTEDCPLDKNDWSHDDTGQIISFVTGFDSPWVRVCYDTGHAHLLGRMIPTLHAFLPYVALFHVHDNEGCGSDDHMQPGYGNAPWHSFFRILRENAPHDAPLYVEAYPYWGDTALALNEIHALAQGRVTLLPHGFLKRDASGRILITPEGQPI